MSTASPAFRERCRHLGCVHGKLDEVEFGNAYARDMFMVAWTGNVKLIASNDTADIEDDVRILDDGYVAAIRERTEIVHSAVSAGALARPSPARGQPSPRSLGTLTTEPYMLPNVLTNRATPLHSRRPASHPTMMVTNPTAHAGQDTRTTSTLMMTAAMTRYPLDAGRRHERSQRRVQLFHQRGAASVRVGVHHPVDREQGRVRVRHCPPRGFPTKSKRLRSVSSSSC